MGTLLREDGQIDYKGEFIDDEKNGYFGEKKKYII